MESRDRERTGGREGKGEIGSDEKECRDKGDE